MNNLREDNLNQIDFEHRDQQQMINETRFYLAERITILDTGPPHFHQKPLPQGTVGYLEDAAEGVSNEPPIGTLLAMVVDLMGLGGDDLPDDGSSSGLGNIAFITLFWGVLVLIVRAVY